MAKIILYKKFSDNGDEIKVKAGKTIKEYYPTLNFSHVIIIANGKKVAENYEIQKNDLILIRWIPFGDGYSVADFFLDILTLGVYSGVKSYKAAEAARKEAEKIKDQRSKTKDDVTNLPYLKGSSNGVATGRTQPYFIGEHIFTPYI